jgi:hypothetical protein
VLTALGRLAEARGDRDEALLRHGEALAAVRPSAMTSDHARVAEGLAGAALLEGVGAAGLEGVGAAEWEGSGERAAWLLGLAVALRGTTVAGDRDVAVTAGRARDLSGAEAFAASYAKAAALDPQQALTVLHGPRA